MPNTPRISVVLALYNGAGFVMEQVESCLAQTVRPVQIVITDDGSTDGGPDMLRTIAAANPDVEWTWIDGPQQGFAANFLAGIDAVLPDIDFVALCDQDDVWLDGKLEQAISALNPQARASVFCGRTWICDRDLANRQMSRSLRKPPAFGNALVQNIVAGNTAVLNAQAVALVKAANAKTRTVVAHDWWIYLLVTGAGGRIIWDDTPQVLYRQHTKNAIGANTGLGAKIHRIGFLMSGRFRNWNATNLTALSQVLDLMTPTSRSQIHQFQTARKAPWHQKVQALRRAKVWRQGNLDQLALYIAALLGRI